MHRRSLAPLAAGVCFSLSLFTGCVYSPINGQTSSGKRIGHVQYFAGYATRSGANIRIQVLRDPLRSGASNADWIDLGPSLTARTTPTVFHPASGDPLFFWSGNRVPVPDVASAARWPEGGLARFRVLQDNAVMRTFDDASCLSAHAALVPPSEVYDICKSHADGTIWMVDTDVELAGAVPGIPPSANPYLSRRATVGAGAAYYAAIGAEPSLALWQSNRGFPAGEVVARYYNAGDLGLGREMHCRTSGGTVSCYVTNYGNPADGLADQFSALADLAAGTNKVATVAMDFRPGVTTNGVRFYVYEHLMGGGTRLAPEVKLDSQGMKSVPGICMACHGGGTVGSGVNGAKFLPFDVDSFRFSSSVPVNQEAFRRLNQMVRSTAATPETVELVDGWYHGAVGVPGTTFDGSFVPDSWRTSCDSTLVSGSPRTPCKVGYVCSSSTGAGVCREDPAVSPRSDPREIATYRQVFAPYCRTCHITHCQTGEANCPDPGVTFRSFTDFNAAAVGPACFSKDMPHAEVIRDKFWKSGARAHMVAASGINTACN